MSDPAITRLLTLINEHLGTANSYLTAAAITTDPADRLRFQLNAAASLQFARNCVWNAEHSIACIKLEAAR